ncbi:MAG: CehA/McbA family metallohydrolase [Chthoniobacter sp.]|uniref:CehA/McbA family metallohydrolase n=1 Tax=Chthoniobacter sp. TaxID=2510640 RepID=UPI0032A42EB4
MKLCFSAVLTFLASLVLAHAAPEAFEVGPAQKGQLPQGKEADGIIGDFLLRNDKVEAVISGNLPLRRANMSTFYGSNGITPGCLYDLTLRGTNNDQLTIFAPAQQQGMVSWVRVVKDGHDGDAVVECAVTGANHDGVARYHQYQVRDGWEGVKVTTTLVNESAEPKKVSLMDKWTNFLRIGNALGIAWADAVDPADKAGYAYGLVDAPAGLVPTKPYDLAPGASVTVARFIAVGHSPVEALGVVAAQRGPVGQLTGTVRDQAGAPVASAEILVRTTGEFDANVGVVHPDADGHFAVTLPEGKYNATFTDLGRPDVVQTVEVKAGTPAKLDAAMAIASAIHFQITDDTGRTLPCKAQFLAIEGTEPANLGPQNRAHGCVDQYHSEKGDFRVQLPPGKYRVVVTHGIEYSHLEQPVTLAAGATFDFTGKLKRLVDTRGWVSADYHNHSTQSGDNTCGTPDRIINLAAENIEFAPTTEHNRLYDWRPIIYQLGLSSEIQTVPGMELTGSLAHLNSFPFKPEPFTQDNGAPVWNPDPRIAAITLRDWQGAEPDRWVQINHPDMVKDFIDADDDGHADGGFHGLAELIDGIETQNGNSTDILAGQPFRIGKNSQGKESVQPVREFIWLQMLNRGHRYAAMAVNDAHTVYGNGVGGWRMYMPSKSDQPEEIDWRENCRHAKAGHSYLTTGPFLQVLTDDGTGPGDTTRAVGGSVKLKVRVQCTDWIDIDRVQVLVNGRARPELNFTRAANPKMFRDGVVKFDETIEIPLHESAHLIVVALGEHSDISLGYGTSSQAKMRPCAYHNPIFVDLDGHGFTPNGDTLGFPLPVAKMTVEEARRELGAATSAPK